MIYFGHSKQKKKKKTFKQHREQKEWIFERRAHKNETMDVTTREQMMIINKIRLMQWEMMIL